MVNIPDAITTLVYKSIAENHYSDAFQISLKLKQEQLCCFQMNLELHLLELRAR
jgi:hypothetical protein